MDDSSDTRNDIKLPDGELGQEIKTKFENGETFKVTILKALGEEVIVAHKPEQDSKK